ncbi:DUF4474 domain-containing protein [Ruminococcus flavefaciens]|uniref:DUF4474 domain-containing protein n=1 Tax=Ruminococcus flavefaciens 007c TaxID=1341157 RepID=W7UKR2_RUMFL|nr:DUF4474 domain-containing protein [Ruminococcus flavefaciens]EWM52139.1 hypothetical protein RF007C_01835 [Ruminococcus flavefaciens 007c]
MATITLYARRVNKMPSLMRALRRSIGSLSDEIDSVRLSALGIDSDVCDLEDVISSLRASSDTQDDLVEFWENVQETAEEFIEDVAEIDEEVSELIETAEEDFYSMYEYLRPEAESWLDAVGDFFGSLWDSASDFFEAVWEEIAGFCQSVTEWIRDHRDLVALGCRLLASVIEAFGDLIITICPWMPAAFALLKEGASLLYEYVLAPLGTLIMNSPLGDLINSAATRFISAVGKIIATEWFGDIVDGFITLFGPFIEIGKIWTAEKLPGADFVVGLIGAVDPDGDGVYHIKQDTWQGWGPVGYNTGYDNVFNRGVSANGNSIDVYQTYDFEFDGQQFVIWAWKGDYMNLGAGTETGIYINSGDNSHYVTGREYALDMSLVLEYDDDGNWDNGGNEVLFNYNPFTDNSQNGGNDWWNGGRQWWVNGFDTNHQNVQADQLRATTTIRFDSLDNGAEMYEALKKSVGVTGTVSREGSGHWEFDDETHVATLVW